MNYNGFEFIKNDIEALSAEMNAINEKLQALSQRYFWKSGDLTERLVGQILHDAKNEQEKINNKINQLMDNFID